MTKECEDAAALLAATGARALFGHSFGGLVALEVARTQPQLTQALVYEPGVSVAGSVPTAWIPRAQGQLARRQDFDAFVQGSTPAAAPLNDTYPHYREIASAVVLLRGERGPTAVTAQRAAAALATVLPHARVVTLPGLDHFGPQQAAAAVAHVILAHLRLDSDARERRTTDGALIRSGPDGPAQPEDQD
jgi:pimeloyl-ACP methyl ester carboxylesterase